MGNNYTFQTKDLKHSLLLLWIHWRIWTYWSPNTSEQSGKSCARLKSKRTGRKKNPFFRFPSMPGRKIVTHELCRSNFDVEVRSSFRSLLTSILAVIQGRHRETRAFHSALRKGNKQSELHEKIGSYLLKVSLERLKVEWLDRYSATARLCFSQ